VLLGVVKVHIYTFPGILHIFYKYLVHSTDPVSLVSKSLSFIYIFLHVTKHSLYLYFPALLYCRFYCKLRFRGNYDTVVRRIIIAKCPGDVSVRFYKLGLSQQSYDTIDQHTTITGFTKRHTCYLAICYRMYTKHSPLLERQC